MSEAAVRSIRITDAALPSSGFVPGSFARLENRATLSKVHHNNGEPANSTDHFAQGFEEGRRLAEDALATERAALLRLIESVSALQPEASEELAMLIGETVYRLVADIVGQVEIDRDCLTRRVVAAAALIRNESVTCRTTFNEGSVSL